MTLPSIPPEITGIILSHLYSASVEPATAHKRLATCCLVSKAILPLARAELYCSLHLHCTSRNTLNPFEAQSARILRTLAEYPHISALVRHLHVSATEAAEAFYTEDVTQTLLGACTNMDKLSISLPDQESRMSDSVKQRFLGVASRLTELGVYGAQWNQDFAELLPAFRALSVLTLGPDLPPAFPTTPTFQLGCLSVSLRAEKPQIDILLQLLSSSHASLSKLYLSVQGILSAEVPLDLSPFIALRHLNVQTDCDAHDVRSLARIKAFIKNLPTRLDHLVTVFGSAYSAPPDLDSINFLRILPPFKTLNLASTPLSTAYILRVLSDPHSLPSTTGLDLDPRLWDSERGRYVRRPREDLFTVMEVAEKRGVQVLFPRAFTGWESVDAPSDSEEDE